MTCTSAGWSKERRAQQSAFMKRRNREPEFIAVRDRANKTWSAERKAAKSEQMRRLNADPIFRQKQKAAMGFAGRRGTMAVPERHHPCVRGFYVEMNAQRATRVEVEERSGIPTTTQSNWHRSMPFLDMLDAALGAFDLELAIVPRGTRDRNGFHQKAIKEGATE